MSKKLKIVFYGIGILLLGIASIYDLNLAKLIYYPDNLLAYFLEEYTSCIAFASFAWMMAMLAKGKHRYFQMGTWLFSFAFSNQVFLVNKYIVSFCFVIFFTVIWSLLCFYHVNKYSHEICKEWSKVIVFYIKLILISYFIITCIKFGWQRVRFRQIDSTHPFHVWYYPQFAGIQYLSFPSGHTTFACSLFAFWIKDVWDKKRISYRKIVLVMIMIVIMAISRMMIGAHYLSDVTMAILICFSIYLWLEGKEKGKLNDVVVKS